MKYITGLIASLCLYACTDVDKIKPMETPMPEKPTATQNTETTDYHSSRERHIPTTEELMEEVEAAMGRIRAFCETVGSMSKSFESLGEKYDGLIGKDPKDILEGFKEMDEDFDRLEEIGNDLNEIYPK